MLIGFISLSTVLTTTVPSSSESMRFSVGSPYSSSFYASASETKPTAAALLATWM